MPGTIRGLCPRCMLRFTLSDTATDHPPAPENTEPTNRLFGDYELVRELGRGGMGVVYEARHLSLNRTVALKMLHPSRLSSPAQLQRFHQEAEAVAALDHPNILPVYEVGASHGQPYFTMKLAERGSLADAIRGAHQEDAASRVTHHIALVAQIARAVHYAHQRGIQHRDLKPHNILIDSGGRPHVSDFGLAKFENRDSSLTLSTDVIGSPAYMSPEQAAGDTRNLTTAADIYALGAVLYELLAGVPPFVAGNVPGLLKKIVEDEPDAAPLTNPDLRTVCLKCLSKDPLRRYSSAEALAEELERWLRGEPVQARPVSGIAHAARWCRRRPALALALAALLITIVVGVTGITVQWRRAEEHAAHREIEKYAADLQVASQALAGHDLGLARRVLDAQIPDGGAPDLRGFEWHLLNELCRGRHQSVLTGHTATVTCAAISPDGRRAVSGGMDATLLFWDLAAGTAIANRKAHGNIIWSVACTPDGRHVVSAGGDGKVRFWTADGEATDISFDGQNAALSGDGSRLAASMSPPFRFFKAGRGVKVWDWRTRRVLFETNAPVRRVALSADGQWLAGGGERRDIFLWNLATGESRRIATTDSPWVMQFSHDGQKLAAAGFNMGARVWNLHGDISSPLVLGGHQFKIWSIAFSPDDRSVVTTGSDRTVQIRDLESPDKSTVMDGHDDEVWDVAWSPDGGSLLTASKDMTLRRWPAQPAAADGNSMPCRDYWQPQFSRGGTRLLTLNDTPQGRPLLSLREVSNGSVVAEFPGRWIAGFGPGGEDVTVIDEGTGRIEHWRNASKQVEAGGSLRGFPAKAEPKAFAISGNGAVMAIGFERDILVWNATNGGLVATIPQPAPSAVLEMSLSPQGDYLAFTVTAPYTIWLRHLPSGRTRELSRHTEEVKGLAFAPDGKTLASAGVDRVIRLWDTASGQLKGELVRYFEEASGVAFSPDGRLLASVGTGQSVNLWHLPTRREVFSLSVPTAEGCIAFSPAGNVIAFTAEKDILRLLRAPMPAAKR